MASHLHTAQRVKREGLYDQMYVVRLDKGHQQPFTVQHPTKMTHGTTGERGLLGEGEDLESQLGQLCYFKLWTMSHLTCCNKITHRSPEAKNF